MTEENTNQEETIQEEVDTQEEVSEDTFTQEDVDDIVEQRLKRERAKLDKKLEEKLNEAERLRKMNTEQKQEYEQEKKDARIAELEAELNRNGLEREATSMLLEQGIAANEYDLNLVVGENAEATQNLVENYAQRIEELADKKLEEYKRGTTPRKTGGSAPISADEIRKIKDPKERIAAIRENRKLFN